MKDDIKIRLITLLSESLSRSSGRDDRILSDLTAYFINNVYGAWKSPETAEEMISVISVGKTCKEPISFE